MNTSSTFWLREIANWWHQHEEMHSIYAHLSNGARDIFSITPYGVGAQPSYSLAQDVIGWGQ